MRFITLVILFLLPKILLAESVSFDLSEAGNFSSRLLQIIALVTVISLAPSILIMVTSFTRIVVVLSFLRSALGLQQTPPNSVMISLALFLTAFIMGPTFQVAYDNGVAPLIEEQIDEKKAFEEITMPFHKFMGTHVRQKDLSLFINLANKEMEDFASIDEIPLYLMIPSFMISELRRAFEIGFLLFIPFVIIDMLVASILMAMGMMMLPPVMISLPFKLIFFVVIDGWYMVCGSLIKSFGG